MSKKGLFVMFGISAIIISFVAYVSFLPEVVVVQVQHVSGQSIQEIEKEFTKASSWKKWYFTRADSSRRFMKLQGGKINGFKWFSDLEGDGALEITQVEDSLVEYQLVMDNNQFRSKGQISWSLSHEGVRVIWSDSLDVSTNVMGRFAASGEGFVDRLKKHNLKTLEQLDQ